MTVRRTTDEVEDTPTEPTPEKPKTNAKVTIDGNYDEGFTVVFTDLAEEETGEVKIITNGNGNEDKTEQADIQGSKDNFTVKVKNKLKKGEYILQAYVGEELLKWVNFELKADLYVEDDD